MCAGAQRCVYCGDSVGHCCINEWQNERGTEKNTLLWYREEYLVVLAERCGYWLLKTAYCTEQSGRIGQLRKERDANLKRLKPSMQARTASNAPSAHGR